jgi:hypothetical protein
MTIGLNGLTETDGASITSLQANIVDHFKTGNDIISHIYPASFPTQRAFSSVAFSFFFRQKYWQK